MSEIAILLDATDPLSDCDLYNVMRKITNSLL